MNAPERALSNEPRVNLAAFLLADKPAERTAFVTPERSLAYGALATCVRAAASGLAARGIDERTRVLLMLEDDLELVVLFLASLAVGAVPAILSSRLDAKSLQAIVERAEPSVVFVADGNDEPVRAATRGGGVRPEIVRVSRFVSGNGPSGVRATGFPGPDADPAWDGFVPKDWEALSFLQFTSGSSGEPKGVMHANRSAIAGCRMVARDLLAIRPDDIVYATSKTFFGFQGASILFPLFAGATAVLDPRWSRPDVAAENIARFRPTMVFAVPSLYRRLLAFDGDLFRTARVAFASGAGLPHNLSIAFEQHFGLKLHEGYGSTELFHLAAAGYPDAPPAGSLGRMLPDVAYEIRTAAGEPAGVERVGELHVNSPARAIGYLGRDDLTAERFDRGWFATGDLFSVDAEGFLAFKGRADDRFKVYGRWVSPFEIESLVKEACPDIAGAIVVPASAADGETRPVLFIVDGEEESDACENVGDVLADRLESYKCPVLYLPIADLPTTTNGKLCRRTLTVIADEALASAAGAPAALQGGSA